MIEVATVLSVGSKVVGLAMGACASATVQTVVATNLPQNLNRFGKITCCIGSAAIGGWIGDQVRKGYTLDFKKAKPQEQDKYIEVNEVVSA